MSLSVLIGNPGDGVQARLTPEGELLVVNSGEPPIQDARVEPFRMFFENNGSNDMKVDGSVTSVVFQVEALEVDDLYITSLSFYIADQNASLSQFGNIGSLANGCKLLYEGAGKTVVIHDSLTSNFEFVRLCSGRPSFGDAGTAFRAANVVGTSDAFIPVLDLRSTFGLPFGVRLVKGTENRFCLVVQDDCTGVDAFDCIAYGFKRLNGQD